MSDRSGILISMQNIRCSKFTTADGTEFAGVFTPEHTNKDGKLVGSKWEGQFLINDAPYRDSKTKELVYPEPIPVRVEAWSKKGDGAKGRAEKFAKTISVGKAMHFDSLKLRGYKKRIYDDGQPMVRKNGNVVTHYTLVFVVNGNFRYGDDSAKRIAFEIQNDTGQASYTGRPPCWNVPGHGDEAAWKIQAQKRRDYAWDGKSPAYGHAMVKIPEGATVGSHPQVAQNLEGATATTAAAELPPSSGQMNAAGSAEPSPLG